jgi:predicted dehydrogenase
MVGGGPGAFIGAVHRLAARMDDRYDFVAGAFSSDPERSRQAGVTCHIDPARAYPTWQAMVEGERSRPDRIDAVAIVTPNNVHYGPAKAFLEAGVHVICDKPLTITAAEATDLVETVRRTGLVFGVTHTYAGYPMVRQAKAMVAAGELGAIRVIQAEYAQSWLTETIETTGQKQAAWRTDPAQSGAGGCLGDIGTHAYHLAGYVSGLTAEAISAELSIFGEGRRLDDNVSMLLRYEGGARGMLWASQVAPGEINGMRLRIFGSKGGLAWQQEQPNELIFTRHGAPSQTLTRGGLYAAGAGRASGGLSGGFRAALCRCGRADHGAVGRPRSFGHRAVAADGRGWRSGHEIHRGRDSFESAGRRLAIAALDFSPEGTKSWPISQHRRPAALSRRRELPRQAGSRLCRWHLRRECRRQGHSPAAGHDPAACPRQGA